MAERPYIVGNWKMNGTRAMLPEARAIDRAAQRNMKVEVAIAPPFTLIHAVHREAEQIGVGAQDCSCDPDGAHTGDISATMVADSGAKFVILGHSERRSAHGETDAMVAAKVGSALDAGLRIILCCGESEATRDAGEAEAFVLGQLRASLPETDNAAEKVTIAYEPIWAIGTGKTATADDAQTVCAAIRMQVRKMTDDATADAVRIQYGGSVKGGNAPELMSQPDIDGALVGGASLDPDEFSRIIQFNG